VAEIDDIVDLIGWIILLDSLRMILIVCIPRYIAGVKLDTLFIYLVEILNIIGDGLTSSLISVRQILILTDRSGGPLVELQRR